MGKIDDSAPAILPCGHTPDDYSKAVAETVKALWPDRSDYEELATTCSDQLADMMHLAAVSGFDFDEAVEHARSHFAAERKLEDVECKACLMEASRG